MKPIDFAGKARTFAIPTAGEGKIWPFAILVMFVVLTFVCGGASRADVLPLLVLRPSSIVACGWGLWAMPAHLFRQYRTLWWLAAATMILVAVQLVPLPPGVWPMLPGRTLVVAVDRAAALEAVWRPVSSTPDLTWNSLFALTTPLATLFMIVSLPRDWSERLCAVLIAIGLASGLLGILQLIGTVDESLSYATRNAGSATGLFANRNHSATFLACLFPVLAVFAAGGRRPHQIVAVAGAIILAPLIVATGSRAGILLGGLAIVLAALLLLDDRRRRVPEGLSPRLRWAVPAFGIATLLILAAVALLVRADTWNRLLQSGGTTEKRLQAWPVVMRLARDQMPLGSGFGSFDAVFRAGEPAALLSPTYFNHAHNDWLELWLTGGIPVVALLAAGLVAWGVAARRVWARNANPRVEGRLARAGSVVLLMLALASMVDYPLRTPSISMFAAIAVAWLAIGQRREAGNANKSVLGLV